MGKSYEERMSEKYNFLKHKDESDFTNEEVNNTTPDNSNIEEIEDQNSIDQKSDTSEESLIVPLDAWNTVLNQLGNLHEASQLMAEARERAAKAEVEAEFLREKLKSTREELEKAKKKKRFLFF
jgi:small-conductance mechanosensitive channel